MNVYLRESSHTLLLEPQEDGQNLSTCLELWCTIDQVNESHSAIGLQDVPICHGSNPRLQVVDTQPQNRVDSG